MSDSTTAPRRGPGRPRKDGTPAQPAKTESAPATRDDWAVLDFTVAQATVLLGDYLHARDPRFPNTQDWKANRQRVTQLLVHKYGAPLAKHSVELQFCLVWGMSFALMRLPAQGAVQVNMADLVSRIKMSGPQDIAAAAPPEPPPVAPPRNGKTLDESLAALKTAETPVGPADETE